MRTTSVNIIALVLLAASVAQAMAEEDTPAADTVAQDVLFEVDVSAAAVPDPLQSVYLAKLTVEPGVDGFVGAGNTGFRGRSFYVDKGELLIEPIAEAFLWRNGASIGGEPVGVPAGEPVRLVTGDVILLPAIAIDDYDPDASIRIANPGQEQAITYGFALYDGVARGGSDAWPKGVFRDPARSVGTSGSAIDPIAGEGAVFRLTRATMAPGAVLGIDKEALFGLYRVEEGAIEATIRGPLGETTRRWTPDSKGGVATELDIADWELRAAGESRTTFLGLTAYPLDSGVAE